MFNENFITILPLAILYILLCFPSDREERMTWEQYILGSGHPGTVQHESRPGHLTSHRLGEGGFTVPAVGEGDRHFNYRPLGHRYIF